MNIKEYIRGILFTMENINEKDYYTFARAVGCLEAALVLSGVFKFGVPFDYLEEITTRRFLFFKFKRRHVEGYYEHVVRKAIEFVNN